MILFSEAQGRVCRIQSGESLQSGTISFSGIDFYSRLKVIIEAHALAFKPTYQISDTLGDDVLLMTFGEAVSPVSIRGVVFDAICDTEPDVVANSDGRRSGVAGFIKWWEDNNLVRQASPIEFQLAGYGSDASVNDIEPMRAHIADMDLAVESSEDRIWRFNMTLLRIPRRRPSLDSRFAGVNPPLVPPPSPVSINVNIPNVLGINLQFPSTPSGFNPVSTPLIFEGGLDEGFNPVSTPLNGPISGA